LGQVDQGNEQDGKKGNTILYKATSMVKYQHLLFSIKFNHPPRPLSLVPRPLSLAPYFPMIPIS
jgi:hypothetical protein